MSTSVMDGFLNRVRAAANPNDDSRTDSQLLAEFGRSRNAASFNLLVSRYGPIVWSVCRRLSGDPHAAEDAFQATFLVLARKADSLRPLHSAGGWLHRTAVHIALKARDMKLRRAQRESQVQLDVAASNEFERIDPTALLALDEEIARLPERLREVVVLCELQGTSRREASARLGIAEGTVSSRLAAARKRLGERLRKRGLGPCSLAGLLAASSAAVAGVPTKLIAATVEIGIGGKSPEPVSVLVEGELRAMFLKTILYSFLGTGLILAAAVGLWPTPTPTPIATASPLASMMAPVPKAVPREGVIVLSSFQPVPPLEFLTPSGDKLKASVALGSAASPINPGEKPVCPLMLARWSPDAKRLLAVKLGPIPQGNVGPYAPMHLWVFDCDSEDGPTEPLLANMRMPSAVWSHDGTKLYGSSIDKEKEADPIPKTGPYPLVCWTLDVKTRVQTALAVPAGHRIVDLSPDGKTLLTVRETECAKPWHLETYLVPLATLKPKRLTEKPFYGMRFSPNGARAIGAQIEERKDTSPKLRPVTVSVADGSVVAIRVSDDVDGVYLACWSPDGKRIALMWHELIPQPPGIPVPVGGGPWAATRVTVCDSDGANAKVIVRREWDLSIRGLDWK